MAIVTGPKRVWVASVGPYLFDDSSGVYADGTPHKAFRVTSVSGVEAFAITDTELGITVDTGAPNPFEILWQSSALTRLGVLYYDSSNDKGIILDGSLDETVNPVRGVGVKPWLDVIEEGLIPTPGSNDRARIYYEPVAGELRVRFSDASDELITASAGGGGPYIQTSFIDAIGDIISGSADDTPVILSVGTDGYILQADSGEASGLKWNDFAAGTWTFNNVATFESGIRIDQEAGDLSGVVGYNTLYALASDGLLYVRDGIGAPKALALDEHTHTASDITDFDTEVCNNTCVSANTSKVTNANHSGEVTGSAALTITNAAVTLAKMANIATDSFIGRDTVGAGVPEVLSATEARSVLNVADGANNYSHPNHTGHVTSSGDGATTITTSVVILAMMADMATNSFIGRDTAGAGVPEILSATDARSILNVADGANNYSHPNHTGNVTSSGDGATTIATGVVTLAMMSNMATASFIGRNTAATGVPEILSATTVRSILNVEDGSTADQTAAEIRTLVDAATDSNVFTNADHTNLDNQSGTNTGDELAASTTVSGVMETATVTEVNTGSDAGRAVSPSSLSGSTLASNVSTNNSKVTNATHTGHVTGSVGLTIANNVVTLGMMVTMATASILGRNTAGIGNVEVLSATTARSVIDVDQAGTDNSTNVTLAGTPNYITIIGQVITRNIIDISTDVTGSLATGTVPWGQLTSVPSTFTPSAHTHPASEITDFDTEVSNNTSVAANTTHRGLTNNPHSVTAAQLTGALAAVVTLGNHSTSDLSEGTNLYYTAERVDDRVAALIQNGTGLAWTYVDGSGTLTGNVSLSGFSTSDLSEGTDLYYTEVRVSANSDVSANTTHRGLTSGNPHSVTPTELSLVIGTNTQAHGDVLDDLNALGAATGDNQFLVSTGVGVVAWESGATARTSLDVDQAGVDNSTDVTLAGSFDYLTLNTQEITLNAVDLSTDVTGSLATGTVPWGQLTSVPSTFTPSAHTHTASDVTDFDTEVGNHVDVAANTTHRGVSSGNPHSVTPTELSLVIGTNVQAWDVNLDQVAGLATADSNFIVGSGVGGWVVESGATARTSLGVDAAGTDNSTNVTLAGSLNYLTISGQIITRNAIDIATDVTNVTAIAAQWSWGTVASTTAIEIIPGTGLHVQNDLSGDTAALSKDDLAFNTISIFTSLAAASHTHSAVDITSGALGILYGGTEATTTAGARVNLGLDIGVNVQAYDANLTNVAAQSPSFNYFLVGQGSAWLSETPAQARASIGLGNVENTTLSTWIGASTVATVGTIISGTWNGSVIASSYLDSDTAHLSTTQTFSGLKTFSGLAKFGANIQLDSAIGIIHTGTSDASDDKALILSGGGSSYGVSRGGHLLLIGNEFLSSPGQVVLRSGDSADVNIGGGLTKIENSLDVTGTLDISSTVDSGTWQGTAIASAYLDADTAHLSTTQIFTGAKTFAADVKFSGASFSIAADTSDGSDTKVLELFGGGDYGAGRGASLRLFGADHSTTPHFFDLLAVNGFSITAGGTSSISSNTLNIVTSNLDLTTNSFGVFSATPVVQQAHIVDANGTLADITTKFNTLLAGLEGYGFLAVA